MASARAVPSSRSFSDRGFSNILLSLRQIVLIFVLLDLLVTTIEASAGYTGMGPTGLEPTVQIIVITTAIAAVMWTRYRLAVVLCALVVVLAFTLGQSGEELTLVLVVAVVTGARARPRSVGLAVAALLAYAIAFGIDQERQSAGAGLVSGMIVVGFAGVGLGVGAIARRLIAAQERRSRRLAEIEAENGQIRSQERHRLADDLQSLVIAGLADIVSEVDAMSAATTGAAQLRAGLGRVDLRCRVLLTELRGLLEVLRREADPALDVRADATTAPGSAWSRWLSVRNLRIVVTFVFVVLIGHAVLDPARPSTTGLVIEVVGLTACGLALWRPWGTWAGVVLAAGAVVVSIFLRDTSGWDTVAVALLFLVVTVRWGRSALPGTLAGLVGYGWLRWYRAQGDPGAELALLSVAGFSGIMLGLTTRHFLQSRAADDRQLELLVGEREQLEADERNAVARELHDVVAHQLSVTTMLVMAGIYSDDRSALHDTVRRVRHSTEAAQLELDTLLHTMRGAAADGVQAAPLTLPSRTAQALAVQLVEHAFVPEMAIDEASDALDATSQRTLVRVMQEATTNILRYADPGSACRFDLVLADGDVRLDVRSALAPRERRSRLSSEWGLRGIRERVDLCHGTFFAGPERRQWRLTITLPLSAPESRRDGMVAGAGAAPTAS